MKDTMKLALAAVLGLAFSFGLAACGPKGPAMDAADLQSVNKLKQAGSNLEKPHVLEFHLNMATEQEAKLAQRELNAQGYRTATLGPDGQNPGWLLVSTKSLVPSPEELAAQRAQMTELAGKYNGHYNGWDADPVK